MSEGYGSDPVEYVVAAVSHNTGGPQPDEISEEKLRLHLVAHGKLTPEEASEAVEQAVDRGRIVEDEEGYRVADDR